MQNPIGEADLEWILHRNCEGTEQLQTHKEMRLVMVQSRTHNCGQLRLPDVGEKVTLVGFYDNMRKVSKNLGFLILRDFYGITQVVVETEEMMDKLSGVNNESTLSITGTVRERSSKNGNLPTGEIEVVPEDIQVLGKCIYNELPFEINRSKEADEATRLKYRYLDLRNPAVKEKIVLRSKVVAELRQRMTGHDFLEITTPILTCSSPEGARDYLVPSRNHPGKFYALPQAPQQFKQLLMTSGFDRYFQIAPCFRDEDARQDRSPGEFYQLDFEMSFATQEEVFRVGEEVLTATFEKFAPEGASVTAAPYPVISYKDAMLQFGSDKPDLRNPLRIMDVTEFFQRCTFKPFLKRIVRAIRVHADMSKGFHEKLLKFATSIGMGGLGYLEVMEDKSYKGPIDKFIPYDMKQEFAELTGLEVGDTIFFIADKEERANLFAGQLRNELGERLDLIEKNAFRFCFVNDFPMYEYNKDEKKMDFTHNPFSMPQGGLEALNTMNPEDILAYQYDIVCNGVELSSGAVRNHDLDIMVKAFEIAGYSEEDLKTKFGALYNAFQFGAPPHAGMAPGVDRIIMLLRNEDNIREVIAFPMNGNAQDLMCGAPGVVTETQLREAHIKVRD